MGNCDAMQLSEESLSKNAPFRRDVRVKLPSQKYSGEMQPP